MAKPEIELQDADLFPWTRREGDPGLTRILSKDPVDGSVTRMRKNPPGRIPAPRGAHDYWEEAFTIDGSITDLTLGKTFTKGCYTCRPPGMVHGPFTTETGFTQIIFCYYKPKAAKPEIELQDADLFPWTRREGDPGLTRTLSRDPVDGSVTRVRKNPPGRVQAPRGAHDYWEEVFNLDGAITDLTLGKTFGKGCYACRPPGMMHGPFTSDTGFTQLIFCHYNPEK